MTNYEKAIAALIEAEDSFRKSKDAAAHERTVATLSPQASLLIVLGPCRAFVRSDGTDGRTKPDNLDLEYYKESLVGAGDLGHAIFNIAGWGEAAARYEEVVVDGMPYPGCRVTWERSLDFAKSLQHEEGGKNIAALVASLALLLGAQWSRHRLEFSVLAEPMLGHGNDWAEPIDIAKTAYGNGDFYGAYRTFQALAALGNIEAQFNLATMLTQGRGVLLNIDEAMKWFHLAAGAGDVSSQYTLGWAYENGYGVPTDLGEALSWYECAAAGGEPQAQYRLGCLFTSGEREAAELQTAFEWFKKASEQGHVDAQLKLASMYENGLGVPQNYSEDVDRPIQDWVNRASWPASKQSGGGGMGYAVGSARLKAGVFAYVKSYRADNGRFPTGAHEIDQVIGNAEIAARCKAPQENLSRAFHAPGRVKLTVQFPDA